MEIPMNAAHVTPDAATNEKLERAGAAAAWYWVCSILFCRCRQEQRAARGEAIDFVPERNSLQLFADTKAKDYVKALVRERLWHEVDGGYRINDYTKVYEGFIQQDTSRTAPAGLDGAPAGGQLGLLLDDIPPPNPRLLGGIVRAMSSRTPAGQLESSQQDTSRTAPAGSVSPRPPSDPEDPQKLENERSRENQPENKGSGGRARRRAAAHPMPAGFQLNAEHREYAARKGWPEWWLVNRFEQFELLARAKGWVYVNWDAALYGFFRGEIGYRRGPADLAHLSPAGSRQSARPLFPVRNGQRQPNALDHLDDNAHAAAMGAKLE